MTHRTLAHVLRKGFCCDRPGAGGEANREAFETAMKTVDVTFQNLDSSEISLTDVSHIFMAAVCQSQSCASLCEPSCAPASSLCGGYR